jgi:hypothetical protein
MNVTATNKKREEKIIKKKEENKTGKGKKRNGTLDA